MSAQTKENASELLQAKHREITKFYPLLKDEIVKSQFSRNDAFIEFTSGGTIDVLANHTNSKWQRRKRINIEEAALLNDFLYQEVLEPIPNKVMNPDGSIGTFNFSVSGGSSGGSGISDVPLDNKSYVRKNQNWSELTELSEPVGGNIDGGTF